MYHVFSSSSYQVCKLFLNFVENKAESDFGNVCVLNFCLQILLKIKWLFYGLNSIMRNLSCLIQVFQTLDRVRFEIIHILNYLEFVVISILCIWIIPLIYLFSRFMCYDCSLNLYNTSRMGYTVRGCWWWILRSILDPNYGWSCCWRDSVQNWNMATLVVWSWMGRCSDDLVCFDHSNFLWSHQKSLLNMGYIDFHNQYIPR